LSQITISKENKRDFFKEVVERTSDIGNEISQALKATKEINTRAHMLATTAKIEANRTGNIGRNFLIVSNSIDELSTKTDEMLDRMKKETIQKIKTLSSVIENKSISIQGNRLGNLALTNIRFIDRNLFERSADIRWWATDDILVKSLIDNNEEGFNNAINRLGVILKSYTVYYDLILCDIDGNCKATGDSTYDLIGRNFSNKKWFQLAMNTLNGTEFGFDSIHLSPAINNDFTAIYSCKVHEGGNPQNKVIGVLGAVFKWREFAQRVVNETSLTPEEQTKTRVLICDGEGNIIADTKERILQQKMRFKGRDELFKKEKGFGVVEKNGNKKLVCHALSPGFKGYKSENWHSLILQDIDMNCHNQDVDKDNYESLDSVIELISHLSEETQKAIKEIEMINDETHVLALNAAIEASHVGDAGRGFGVISGFMGDLSRTTAKITAKMDSNIQEKINQLNSLLASNSQQLREDRLINLSFTNIDLIDRALYERTADVQWWATESSVTNALTNKTNKNKEILSIRLGTILQYYTVYDDLIVCDFNGDVIANGSSKNREDNMSNTQWFQNILKNNNGKNYGFDIIHKDYESSKSTSLVFTCKVNGKREETHECLGVLAIMFNWEDFINTIFSETPLNENELDSSNLFILDSNGNKLSEINKKEISEKDMLPLLEEKRNSRKITLGNSQALSGHAQSVGYEGFSTGWHSIIIQSK